MPVLAERPPATAREPKAKTPGTECNVLRCLVYPSGGSYAAECIDLDLMASGATQLEAYQSLITAVTGYLATVSKGDSEGLVPRRAPLSHRIRYHFYALLAALSTARHRRFLISDYPVAPCRSTGELA